MDGELDVRLEARRRTELLRNYILPIAGRIAAMALGMGLGYIIGNI